MKKIMNKFPLYLQVIFAIILAVLFGLIFPKQAEAFKPLGDIFIKLIKMCIPPIIFCTVVGSFVSEKNVKVGSLSLKSFIYFEVLTTFALIVGLSFAMFFDVGTGLDIPKDNLDTSFLEQFKHNQPHTFADFIINIVPKTVFEAFTSGEILPMLFISVLFGFVFSKVKKKIPTTIILIKDLEEIAFKLIEIIVKLSPFGAFGAMAYTVGKYGSKSIIKLFIFTGLFYGTCIFFVLVVLGSIMYFVCKKNIFTLIAHIKDEILVVLGTSSSETVLPAMIEKMEKFGCKQSVVSFALPAGYAFNLDGTCIYFTMAIIFLSQVFGIHLSWMQIFQVMFVLLITSKGAAAVVGSAFITLTATLSAIPVLPIESLAIIFGIDRFMSTGRAITNLIGNAVATVVLDKWQKDS
ncbi:MAG: C4-dicarboxylate transporter DctA [Proteobacteria bacterium]|nr:C4-dicarboxylate transporter DctA [Pseudomonadota bacterium]